MRFLKRSITLIFAFAVILASIWTAFAFSIRDKYVVPILMYHSVALSPKVSPSYKHVGLNTVTPASFDRQMAYLKKNGYQVISLSDLVEGLHKLKRFDRKTAVITFDDGYADNYTNAFPILKKYAFPAMIFMIVDSIGTPEYMNVDQLKEMGRHGIKIGSHTRRHAYLPGVSPEQQVDEIINSKKILEEHLGHPVELFSYPIGGFSASIKEIVKQAGYHGACATNRGFDRSNKDIYELKRIRVKDDDGNLVLWAKLSGYYNLFRVPKNPY